MEKSDLRRILSETSKENLRITRAQIETAIASGSFDEAIKKLTDEAETLRGTDIMSTPFSNFKLFDIDGNRLHFESDKNGYFPRRHRLGIFATLVLLYGREEDISELEDIIWAICDEYTWSLPAHLGGKSLERLESDGYTIDLFSSETAASLSEIIFLLGDKLAPIVVKRAKYLVMERVIKRYLSTPIGWEHAISNWAAVCGDSVGTCGLYLEEDLDDLCDMIIKLQTAWNSFLLSFPEDGACLEGIGYWNYGFSHYVYFADMLYRRTEGKINMFDVPKVRKIAEFQQKCFFKGGRSISYSDGHSYGHWSIPLTQKLHDIFDTVKFPPKEYGGLGFGSIISSTRTLLWAKPLPEYTPEFSSCCLPDAQWLIGNSENGVGFSAKGGDNDEPHNHNDIGSFLIFKNGEEMLSDLGGGEYTKDYFLKKRYEFFVCGSQGHSVPIINGIYQSAGREFCAKDVKIDEHNLSMDISPAYKAPGLQSLYRAFSFCDKTGKVTLRDDFSFEAKPESVVERLITYSKPEISGGKITLSFKKETEILSFDSEKLSPSVNVATFSDHVGRPTDVYVIDFAAKSAETKMTFNFIFE